MDERTFRVVMSERCYRFKPDSIPGHAPDGPGVYEFVTFDPARNPVVLFVGAALDATVRAALTEHLLGRRSPTAQELFARSPDVYFDFVARSDARSPEDLRDLAAALVARHSPPLNASPDPGSGRFRKVEVQEVESL